MASPRQKHMSAQLNGVALRSSGKEYMLLADCATASLAMYSTKTFQSLFHGTVPLATAKSGLINSPRTERRRSHPPKPHWSLH